MGGDRLADIARSLYTLPLGDFVAARTSAARSAATEFGATLAAEVRTLPKPSVAAWALNMLIAHCPEKVSKLAGIGESMRAAQLALDAGTLRGLAQQRRKAISEAMEAVRTVAEQQGRRISGPVASGVEQTLRAAVADERAAAAIRSGRLLRVLSADGLDRVDLNGAVAVPSAAVAPAVNDERASADTAPGQLPKTDKPLLRIVAGERRAPASAIEKSSAALAEAENAARAAVEEVKKHEERLESASAAVARLADSTHRLRERLTAMDAEFATARRRRDSAAAGLQQASRAAGRMRRAEMLARERVFRLRNTQD
ncbi:hypothetical protein [Pseudarthrobacter sp. N5]|uniref:hypothetical protein n=1 Tax=Pseudarthrobacter sp. N5 TaxID=3418416 RepID=UPI003CF26B6A